MFKFTTTMLIVVPAKCKVVFLLVYFSWLWNKQETNNVLLYCISKMNINAAFVFNDLLNTYSGVFVPLKSGINMAAWHYFKNKCPLIFLFYNILAKCLNLWSVKITNYFITVYRGCINRICINQKCQEGLLQFIGACVGFSFRNLTHLHQQSGNM